MKLERLLVIIDPDQDQQPALQRALWLARQSGVRLHLLQVDYHPRLESGLLDGHMLKRAREALLQQRQDSLHASVAEFIDEGLQIDVEVRWHKHRHEAILARAAELQVDLLLKSAHPGGMLRRLLFSDTYWQLIRHCPMPLWLVHDMHWRGQRMCTALDPLHSADKPAALDHKLIRESQALQMQLGLQGDYVHALAPMPHSLLFDAEVAQAYDDYVTRSARAHRQAFDALIGQYPIAAERAHLLDGFAEDAIPNFVHKHNIDLLVMGAIARGQLDSLLIGHTAERVLERVECDLLVLKADDKG